MDHVREFVRYWAVSGRSKLTADNYALWLRRYECSGRELPPTLAEARDWVIELREAGTKSATLLSAVRSIKAFSKYWAIEYDEDDALKRLPFPRVDEPVPGRIAQDDDIDAILRLWKGRRDFASVRNTAIVTLMRGTGKRRAELTRICVADVNLEEDVIMLPRTKTYQQRIIPISNAARVALLRYLRVRPAHRAAKRPELFLICSRAPWPSDPTP